LRLPYDKLSWLPNADQMYLRDLADSMVRYAEDLDAVRERARVIQDNITNQLTEKVNNKMYILSIIAIIFMPASFITGIFGMDIEVPGATNKHTFYILCSIIVVLSVGLFVWFRRKKWL
jgi:zinc transporter